MSSGQWVTGVTAYELAKVWGISTRHVEADSAEASRLVCGAVASDAEIKARVLAGLETFTSLARRKGELRTGIEGLKAIAAISGVEAARKVEHLIESEMSHFLRKVRDVLGDEAFERVCDAVNNPSLVRDPPAGDPESTGGT